MAYRHTVVAALCVVLVVSASAQNGGVNLVQRKLTASLSSQAPQAPADAFEAVEGGINRVCRGINASDDDNSYYVVHGGSRADSIEACKSACVDTLGCRGIEFRPGRCEVWVRVGGIQAAAVTNGPICLRYVPFVLAEGQLDRACRGGSVSDNNPAYYEIMTASSIEACQDLCLGLHACVGIEFSGTRCEIWTRSERIAATASLSQSICQPHAPFIQLDGSDRACRGRDASDNEPSYYTSHESISTEACKSLCAQNPLCQGIEVSSNSSSGSCKVWTRASGIQATAPLAGALCLRSGTLGVPDAFMKVDGGSDRACRGQSTSDWSPSYFLYFSAAQSPSLDDCKSRCLKNADCKGIDFSANGCNVWTRPVTTSISFTGSTCLQYEPFVGIDGGDRRGCFGSSPQITTLAFPTSEIADQCKAQCAKTHACQGIEYSSSQCNIWTSAITGSYASDARTCMRYQPFVPVAGGLDKACGGIDSMDAWPSYYTLTSSESLSVASCKTLCLSTIGCRGIQYSATGGAGTCQVWTRRGGIQSSRDLSGSLCLRLGPWDTWEDASAFVPMYNPSSPSDSYVCGGEGLLAQLHGPEKAGSVQDCELRCASMPGCRGVDFGTGGCRTWHGSGAVAASAAQSESACHSFQPFRDVDGEGRACRGETSEDVQSSYYLESSATSLQDCQDQCVRHSETLASGASGACKGISYDSSSGTCRVWTLPAGIGATAAEAASFCQRYEPFVALDGGHNRACRGWHSQDISASYYTSFLASEVASLEACRIRCLKFTNCRGVEFGPDGCKIWTRDVRATAEAFGSICLRFASLGLEEVAGTADAFQPVEGGAGRACRGANSTDTQGSYYDYYHPSVVTTMSRCKALCIETSGCQGVQFSIHGCQIWTRVGGIQSTAPSPDLTCLSYKPFRLVDGFSDRSCRGTSVQDNAPSNFLSLTSPSLAACQSTCAQEPGCKGVEYNVSGTACEVWTLPSGITASVASPGTTCMRYEPFVAADGGLNRSCRGADVDDDWPSYYAVREYTWSSGPSIEECKGQCLSTPGCRGVEYTKAQCKIWTRQGGIQATAASPGSLCLRFGPFDPLELLDAFWPFDGADRACRGSSRTDLLPSYYTSVGPDKAASLEACKSLCVRTAGCKAIQFTSTECQLWTRSGGVQATVAQPGSSCLLFRPFRAVDGAQDRRCASSGANGGASDSQPSDSLASCQMLCQDSPWCAGISFESGNCSVLAGEFSSEASQGSQCLSYEPFVTVDGGVDRACRGSHQDDLSSYYYKGYSLAEVPTLEVCKLRCAAMEQCQGLDFSAEGCKVWNRTEGIQATKASPGSHCLRYGRRDPVLDTSSFKPVDGGVGRACRGQDETDNLDSHYTVHVFWPENSTLEACQQLCMETLACKGVEFRLGACEIWNLAGGIQASVGAPGRTCMRYEPFQSVDGFSDRVCRGSSSSDTQDSYYAIYSPTQAPSMEACQSLCKTTPGCQGIEYRGWCEVWTRPDGIGAVAPSLGSQCLRYQPFAGVDGGVNRACRGVDPTDSWSIYYTVFAQEQAATVEACKAKCIAASGCRGIQFQPGRCEVWTRRAGIGATVASAGTICMRYDTFNVAAASDAFVTVGPNQACRGSSPTDDQPSYYILRGPDVAANEEECRLLCMATPECQGIDFSSDGCKVWTRKAGIESSAAWGGATCLRYDPFEPVDGGEGRACRGADVNDDSQDNYVLHTVATVPTLVDCKIKCASTTGCKGVSFSESGCQVWIRSGGIQASAPLSSSSCFRYMPFTPVGGDDQACRGAHSQDNNASYYQSFSAEQVPSMELCRLRCAATDGCTGVEFGALGCKVWTRFEGIQATEFVAGSLCLRFGSPNELLDAGAFRPIDGGVDRACRGRNETDNLDEYYTLFWAWPENASLQACQDRCVRTPGCRGVEFRMGGCEIWTTLIEATVPSAGRTCLKYKPFRTLDGFKDRVCRGSSSTDSLSSYYTLTGPDVTPTLDACQNLCVATPACKGVEYRGGWCEIWRRPEGIGAVAVSPGADCWRYEPFLEVDGGLNRACRGADAADSWSSYYTLVSASSLLECKEACLTQWNCKGLEYRQGSLHYPGRCEVWTRQAGIQASAPSTGSLCLRLGGSEELATDAFFAFQGGLNRACRGSDPADDQASYYDWYGPAGIETLEQCKLRCASTPNCRGIDFSDEGCKVWTREVASSSESAGSTCLLFQPFHPVDGGDNRECRGSDTSDISEGYYIQNPALALQDCKLQCATTSGCTGISYNTTGSSCRVWTATVRSSVEASGSSCLRYGPFVDVNGGRDQSCRGGHIYDNAAFYYRSYTLAQVPNLEACKVECVGTRSCKGVDFSPLQGCKVWTRVQGIEATAAAPGSVCVRYGVPDPLRSADAFPGMDGGINRACRGANETDNDEKHWIFYPISQVRTLEACQLRCIFKPGCMGVEFNRWGCEVWMRPEGIQASVYASGYQCFRFKPFEAADGFNDRACRGQDVSDNMGSYLIFYGLSSGYDGQRSTCEHLCASTSGCKGIEFSSGHCEVWTREAGIQATAPALGSSCLRFEPFSNVEGGVDRACRGEDPFDNWPSYYTLTSASSVQGCKQLCMSTPGCHGIEFSSSGRCELWTRARGIGSSSAAVGYVCMRYGSWDPSDVLDGFLPADGAFDRACRGRNRTDMDPSHYVSYALDIAPTLGACKAICTVTPGCKGVEYSNFGCEVWTRAEGIEATAEVSGFQCYRYVAFEPVDGGTGRACRGADASDNAPGNFVLYNPSEVPSLDQCQARCVARPGCRGVSYDPAEGCELWTRPFGVEATVAKAGSSCFRHEPFTSADGGQDRACRGAQPWDNSSAHYREATLPIPTLAACKVACVNSPGCKGIEFQPTGKCLIWTRPGGIDATATAYGSICLRHGATQAGATEEGSLVGQIHLALDPRLCLDIAGFNNGDSVQVGPCSSSARFVMNDGTAQIRLAEDMTKCLDVSGGVKSNGTRIQVWDCETPVHGNMQFLFPDGGVGQLRWATYLDMCLQPMGNTSGSQVILWNCRRASGYSRVVLPSGEMRTVRTPKFVAHYLPWFLGNNVDEACARSGPDCPYKNDHWCSAYGNSYYASYLGAYDITGPSVIETQLDLMKASGLDGLWIDYQMPTWDASVDRIVAGLKQRGMGFAIMVDAATFPDVMNITAEKVKNWTQEPHYYRHQGLPIVPVWNNNFTIFTPLPVNAIYISRFEFDPPEWASDTYTWVQDDYLVRYYEQHHPVVSSGSAFRGYRDCYFDKTLKDPNVTQLDITLSRARQHRPEYVQLVTWNDYTEGTQLEPSWIRREGECVDVCGESCLTVSDCDSYGLLTDCTKPVGSATGPADPSCNVTGNLSAFADINQVAQFIARERYIGQVLAQAARYAPL